MAKEGRVRRVMRQNKGERDDLSQTPINNNQVAQGVDCVR